MNGRMEEEESRRAEEEALSHLYNAPFDFIALFPTANRR